MSALPTFDEVDVPVRTRATNHPGNPFGDVVKALAIGGKAKRFTVEADKAKATVNQLRRAGRDNDRTVRTRVDEAPDGKNVIVTFWAVSLQTRKTKNETVNKVAELRPEDKKTETPVVTPPGAPVPAQGEPTKTGEIKTAPAKSTATAPINPRTENAAAAKGSISPKK